MHMDPVLPAMVGTIFIMLLVGGLLKLAAQPQVIAYLVAGVLIGPHGVALIDDADVVNRLGAMGVVLLLFFVGMEVVPQQLMSRWRIPVIGTLLQVLFSLLPVALIGLYYDWGWARIVLLTFVISLSSSAVVIRLLQDRKELGTGFGQDMLGVLLVQDLLVIPMLIVIGLFGGQEVNLHSLSMQLVGVILVGLALFWIFSGRQIRLPLARQIREDHELQVFVALAICFGMSLLTGILELSTALGAFIAGMLVGAARETQWVHHKLEPFKVVFVALFFLSVGMSLDLQFLLQHWWQLSLLVVAVFVVGTLLNAIILGTLGYRWRESLYGGAVLAQIGEFSFVLSAVGMQAAIISAAGYQYALSVISLSLLLGPLWIALGRRCFNPVVSDPV
ncbi:cation:proton antiporter [Marinobacterium jannaschii]|uniref:cation:proton antiporter n=1 Tax=Marinobacterium jannaschii TaxID=64970 RepID=UPI000488F52F|nr:cation:proton antiporter [Marinobacterium jannaschii]